MYTVQRYMEIWTKCGMLVFHVVLPILRYAYVHQFKLREDYVDVDVDVLSETFRGVMVRLHIQKTHVFRLGNSCCYVLNVLYRIV